MYENEVIQDQKSEICNNVAVNVNDLNDLHFSLTIIYEYRNM